MTAKLPYERPTITRQVEGLMNKVGRPAPARALEEIDGVPVSTLVEKHGSPLFVFSERGIRRRAREAQQLFSIRYPKVQFAWSYKTNYLDAVCAVFHSEGAWAEVVSAMEYEKARRLGVPGRQIIYNGPYKTTDSLRRALREGALINIDHLDELAELETLAGDGEKPGVGLRLNLDAGIIPQWHRFGFNLEGGQAYHAVKRLAAGGKLDLVALHCHLGTFILDPLAYSRAVEKLLDFAAALKTEFGFTLRYLNLGGGFASTNTLHTQYLPGDQSAPSLAQYADALTEPLIRRQHAGEIPTLLLETGRALIDEAGSLIATVQGTKRLASGRRAIILDAGLNVLLTTWWYRLHIIPAQPGSGLAEETAVYGPLCMNIDCLRENIVLPDLQRGDRVVIRPAGAYCFTQSMQFIALRPACVLIAPDSKVDCIRRAETLDDLVGPEALPDRLRLGQ